MHCNLLYAKFDPIRPFIVITFPTCVGKDGRHVILIISIHYVVGFIIKDHKLGALYP